MNEYIKQSVKVNKSSTLHGRDIIVVATPLPDEISFSNILRRVEMSIPSFLLRDLDAIYVGDFDILKPRDLKAMYFKGTIYVSNEQDTEEDFYQALVHEISHHVEVLLEREIYSDGLLKMEFLSKRRQLFDILEMHGYNISWEDMMNHKFDEGLDKFFYWSVGYEKLATLVGGIFISPYAATSLREYWGKGFEEYVRGNKEDLSVISPVLYDKIELTLVHKGEKHE